MNHVTRMFATIDTDSDGIFTREECAGVQTIRYCLFVALPCRVMKSKSTCQMEPNWRVDMLTRCGTPYAGHSGGASAEDASARFDEATSDPKFAMYLRLLSVQQDDCRKLFNTLEEASDEPGEVASGPLNPQIQTHRRASSSNRREKAEQMPKDWRKIRPSSSARCAFQPPSGVPTIPGTI